MNSSQSLVYHERMSDAHLYLQGSLVKWGDKIVKVLYVEESGLVGLQTSQGAAVAPYHELDLTPIELGYVFSPSHNQPLYLERMPTRQWRQGLTISSLRDREGYGVLQRAEPSIDYIKRLGKRRFPGVFRALRLAKKLRTTIPFHKHYAIDYNGLVSYKTKVVGSFSTIDKRFIVLEPYSFLSYELEEIQNVHHRYL